MGCGHPTALSRVVADLELLKLSDSYPFRAAGGWLQNLVNRSIYKLNKTGLILTS
jgi:hypothetical protein